ncbi:MAG: TonB-dependent receptor, partial [Acidobacteriota bacterium]
GSPWDGPGRQPPFVGPPRTRLGAGGSNPLRVAGAGASGVAQSATGAIDGVVVDQSHARLPGVTITLLHSATSTSRTVVTDANGWFRAPLLPVGVYQLTAALAGFQTLTREIALTVGQIISMDLEMRVAAIAETIVVAVVKPVIERSRHSASSTVNDVAIQHLPVNGRNFIDLVLLTPGVTRDRGGELSFAGQRGTLNSLVVDGADNNHTFFGRTLGQGRAPYQFSLDVVKEFQVNSNAFSAEYGRAGAGVINVVTRSGTNALAGSVFEYYRDKTLNGVNAINRLNNQPKSPYHYHQFGGTAGGPLRVNRDFFFFGYDGQRNRLPQLVFLNLPPNTPGDAETAAAIEMLRPLAESWSRALDQDVFLIKTDHEVLAGHRVTLRYNHQNFTGQGYENFGPQQAFEHSGDSIVRTRTLNASWIGVFKSRLFNEARFQVARDHEPGKANSERPEADVQQGGTRVFLIGQNNFSPRENMLNRVQVADTITWTRGSHLVKAGADVQFDWIRNHFPGFFGGSYMFSSLASFARGRPIGPGEFYRQGFAGPGTSGAETRPDLREYSFFMQDHWKPRSDVSLSLGLRYDFMVSSGSGVRNPDAGLAAAGIDTSVFPADANNFGPRLGVAWSPANRAYVVRGGWGLFYGRTPMIMATAAGANNGLNTISLTFTGQAVPTYPQRFSDIPPAGTAAVPSIVYADEGFANPRLMQANVAVEWELARETSLAATYLRVRGTDLPRSVDRNIGTLGERNVTVAATGQVAGSPFFGPARPFPRFQRVVAFESSAESSYNGLTIELNRRFVDAWQFRVAYTLGKVIDTVPDATAVLPGNAGDDAKHASHPMDFEVDRTAGNNDQRHRLVASGVYTTSRLAEGLGGTARALIGGWWVGGILTAQSGQPFSPRVNGDLNGDGNPRNDLSPGARRNALRLPLIVTLDPRVVRDVPLPGRARVQIIWETFNLFNRDNINNVRAVQYTLMGSTLASTSDFGQPISSAGERIMQLAVKVSF